jgi:hypothetical protein
VHSRLWWGNLRDRDHFEETGRRWEDNIKIDLQEVGWRGMDWIDLAEDRDRWGDTCECGDEPSDSIKCGELLQKESAPWSNK